MPLLSLLIPTLACRGDLLKRLLKQLYRQCGPGIEVLIDRDNGEATIGDKRNRLLERAGGDFLAFIDDDDGLSPDYCARLVIALETRPDCVGFKVTRYIDGRYNGEAIHTIANERCDDAMVDGHWRHRRWPGHLQPIRSDLARQVRFQPWCFGEDRDYAARLRPLLKTESFVDRPLYTYLCRSEAVRQHEIVHPHRWGGDGNARLTRTFDLTTS